MEHPRRYRVPKHHGNCAWTWRWRLAAPPRMRRRNGEKLSLFRHEPLLPNEAFGPEPYRLFNPAKIWVLVILIAGIGFAGYVGIKFLGPGRGITLATAVSESLFVCFGPPKHLLGSYRSVARQFRGRRDDP